VRLPSTGSLRDRNEICAPPHSNDLIVRRDFDSVSDGSWVVEHDRVTNLCLCDSPEEFKSTHDNALATFRPRCGRIIDRVPVLREFEFQPEGDRT
jgi:hypothetical protein